jgi:hypothetical protein
MSEESQLAPCQHPWSHPAVAKLPSPHSTQHTLFPAPGTHSTAPSPPSAPTSQWTPAHSPIWCTAPPVTHTEQLQRQLQAPADTGILGSVPTVPLS